MFLVLTYVIKLRFTWYRGLQGSLGGRNTELWRRRKKTFTHQKDTEQIMKKNFVVVKIILSRKLLVTDWTAD